VGLAVEGISSDSCLAPAVLPSPEDWAHCQVSKSTQLESRKSPSFWGADWRSFVKYGIDPIVIVVFIENSVIETIGKGRKCVYDPQK
jgi:hypothetical protein